MTRLLEEALQLSVEQKKQMIYVLKNSLEDKRIDERFKQLKKAADEVIGENILSDSRERPVVFGRRMVAYVMRKEGNSLESVGRRLNKDHSTICTLCKGMEDILQYPKFFKEETEAWKRFKNMVDYDDSRAS